VLTTVKEIRKVFKIPYSVFNGLSVDWVGNSLGILRDHVMPYRGVGCDTQLTVPLSHTLSHHFLSKILHYYSNFKLELSSFLHKLFPKLVENSNLSIYLENWRKKDKKERKNIKFGRTQIEVNLSPNLNWFMLIELTLNKWKLLRKVQNSCLYGNNEISAAMVP